MRRFADRLAAVLGFVHELEQGLQFVKHFGQRIAAIGQAEPSASQGVLKILRFGELALMLADGDSPLGPQCTAGQRVGDRGLRLVIDRRQS